eukprot:TRINITY_DN899_c0_g1_i1.p1 TRINITY_DN899_c0_g1~~TRINITY_DN899_c0_g1_i1.p1  ORF type:complete len:303 (-),score=41.56 TRINITY_DN899_c0_g1_i1:124-1032(-)
MLIKIILIVPLIYFSFCLAGAPYVGMEYETWFLSPQDPRWNSRKVTPQRGLYSSHDPDLIRAHGQQIHSLGVDFILIDWSNQGDPKLWPTRPDLNGIVTATDAVFDTFLTMPGAPQIVIMLDCLSAGSLSWIQETADIVWQRYYTGERAKLYFQLYGKPLLTAYLMTPAWSVNCGGWNDPRFEIRFVTGFTEAQNLEDKGVWSWVSRNPVGVNKRGSFVEEMTVSPATCQYGPGGGGRSGGAYYVGQWDQALQHRPLFVLICQWNEYGEETSPECSNEVEPTVEYKDQFMNITRQYVARLKN